MSELLTHACEQVLRFTQVARWDDLSEERKVQLGFNLGVVVLGLALTKQEGYDSLADSREGRITMADFRDHLKALIRSRHVAVDETRISRPL